MKQVKKLCTRLQQFRVIIVVPNTPFSKPISNQISIFIHRQSEPSKEEIVALEFSEINHNLPFKVSTGRLRVEIASRLSNKFTNNLLDTSVLGEDFNRTLFIRKIAYQTPLFYKNRLRTPLISFGHTAIIYHRACHHLAILITYPSFISSSSITSSNLRKCECINKARDGPKAKREGALALTEF
ncbi:hypothetical protein PIB30_092171 [Stylosanthes scabra]|uniref:Uncharacterized protein n=1 Tax=Stylosanthes scabra TaxID=79078 RepID=A0ABU6VUN4_9FABA|nr:hypothetical protein [Stylosanthes scabra]